MGAPAARMMDMGSGHQVWPPHNCIMGCFTVIIEGRPACRTGDMWMVHCAPYVGCHPGAAGMGSDTVIVGGMPQSRIGDDVMCGSTIMTGAFNVIVG